MLPNIQANVTNLPTVKGPWPSPVLEIQEQVDYSSYLGMLWVCKFGLVGVVLFCYCYLFCFVSKIMGDQVTEWCCYAVLEQPLVFIIRDPVNILYLSKLASHPQEYLRHGLVEVP